MEDKCLSRLYSYLSVAKGNRFQDHPPPPHPLPRGYQTPWMFQVPYSPHSVSADSTNLGFRSLDEDPIYTEGCICINNFLNQRYMSVIYETQSF